MKDKTQNNYFSFLLILIIILVFNLKPVFSQNLNYEDTNKIRQLIEQKNEELKKLILEREKIEKELEKTNTQKNLLQKELNKINNLISQLNNSIKTNEILIEKLSLEIKNLDQEIQILENKIKEKKEAIAKIFVEIQQKENENILFVFFKKQRLFEGVSDIQQMINLNQNLNNLVNQLTEYRNSLEEKLNELDSKKNQKEIEKNNLINQQYILTDQKKINNQILTQTKNQEKYYQEKIEELEKKQQEISQFIESLEEKLRKSFNVENISKDIFLSYPVDYVFITQNYGRTDFAQRAYKTKFHNGIDFRAPIGTPIKAAADGVVFRVDNNDRSHLPWQRYQYGMYVLIKHENNFSTLYAHLSRTTVKNGEQVKKGQIIGYSGNTGYSFGPHLHFGIYLTSSIEFKSIPPANGLVPIGATLNPLDYLPKI